MEDYKKKYEEALGRARTFSQRWQGIEATDSELALQELKEIFPELKESEDEMIRKDLIGYFEACGNMTFAHHRVSDIIAWLEKQGEQEHVVVVPRFRVGDVIRPKGSMAEYTIESIYGGCYHGKGWGLFIGCDEDYELVEQKPADKVESKFKVGDWGVWDNKISCHVDNIYQGKNSLMYTITDTNNMIRSYSVKGFDNNAHLWTIQDAKDGDVLANDNGSICIFDGTVEEGIYPFAYCGLTRYGFESYDRKLPFTHDKNIYPATREQRDLLFAKMKEAGYEWDAEKKELKKIEQKPEIKDDVLSRFAFYQYDDDTIYLSSVFVEECNRKHGYGTKILKAAEKVAKTFGVSKIRLKVERNTWMEGWYKKNGYEYLSSEGKYDWLENKVIDIKPTKIEQKPVWSKEDENILNEFIESLRYCNGNGYNKQIDWLKSLKERMKGE